MANCNTHYLNPINRLEIGLTNQLRLLNEEDNLKLNSEMICYLLLRVVYRKEKMFTSMNDFYNKQSNLYTK